MRVDCVKIIATSVTNIHAFLLNAKTQRREEKNSLLCVFASLRLLKENQASLSYTFASGPIHDQV